MIEVIINETRRELTDINPSWIHDQIRGRENNGVSVCVRITIKTSGINITLSCGNCGSSGGGGRRPNLEEERIFTIWEKLNIKETPINSGKLIAFLQQIKSL